MIDLDQDLLDRMTAAFTPKALLVDRLGATRVEAVHDIVRQVIADTALVLDGSVPLDRWETPDPT